MTSVSRSTESPEQSGACRVSIEADTPAELLAEMAMLGTSPSDDPVRAARACARLASMTVLHWAEELEAAGYRDLGMGRHNGRWHAHFLMPA